MNYSEALNYLDTFSMFGIKLGLEQTEALFDTAGINLDTMRFIHVAGTNGKGSTSAMIERGLRECGYKTGFYSSPHLISIRERFRVNGQAISENDFAKIMSEMADAASLLAKQGMKVTYFELTTALALKYFMYEKVDFVVLETGMGGRLDSTNVVTPEVSVITNIALDHQKYLGDTIAEIASEKAGIIKTGIPVFAGIMPDEAMNVIENRAKESASTLIKCRETNAFSCWNNKGLCSTTTFDGYNLTIPLPGLAQRHNGLLAAEVLKYLARRHKFDIQQAFNGMSKTLWPARMQKISQNLWVDGGHNPDGVTALVQTLSELYNNEKIDFIFGAFADKDVMPELQLIAPMAAKIVFVPIANQFRPSWAPHELQAKIAEYNVDLEIMTAVNLAEALKKLDDDHRPTVIAGSLYLAAEALQYCLGDDSALNI